MFYKGNVLHVQPSEHIYPLKSVCVCSYTLLSVILCECDKDDGKCSYLWVPVFWVKACDFCLLCRQEEDDKCMLTVKTHRIQIYTHTNLYLLSGHTHTDTQFKYLVCFLRVDAIVCIHGGTNPNDNKQSERKYWAVLPILSLPWGCLFFSLGVKHWPSKYSVFHSWNAQRWCWMLFVYLNKLGDVQPCAIGSLVWDFITRLVVKA